MDTTIDVIYHHVFAYLSILASFLHTTDGVKVVCIAKEGDYAHMQRLRVMRILLVFDPCSEYVNVVKRLHEYIFEHDIFRIMISDRVVNVLRTTGLPCDFNACNECLVMAAWVDNSSAFSRSLHRQSSNCCTCGRDPYSDTPLKGILQARMLGSKSRHKYESPSTKA
ncbi:hypothetical protein JOM56_014618 [Amanita muscaria]